MKDASKAIQSAFSRSDRHPKLNNMRGRSMHPVLAYTKAWTHGTRHRFVI